MEKWKSWAIGIGAGWVLLAFVSWHVESKCGVFFGKACFSEFLGWTRWVILLKWVDSYQQLLAGIAAIIGGAFVVLAGREQIKNMRETRKRERLEQALDSFYTIGTPVSDYNRQLKSTLNKNPPLPLTLPDHTLLKDLHYICPQLAQSYILFQAQTSSFYEKCQSDKNYYILRRKYMLATSGALFDIFNQIATRAGKELDFQPRVVLRRFGLKQKKVEQMCEAYGLEKKHFAYLSKYFPYLDTLDKNKKSSSG
ncbi:hypothetical protein F9K77_14350 [Ochrobactrum sp. LMG 5442]|nr:hypothetical protein F9K77_14350 [Ochrobactrum sp. LMG 5442]